MSASVPTAKDTGNYSNKTKCPHGRLTKLAVRASLIIPCKQVHARLTPENTEREFGPLEGISDNYEKLVLSTDTLLRINRGGIRQKNIVDFLLET